MTIRPAQESDWRYVYPTFIASFRDKSTHSDGLPGKLIARLLTNIIANGWTCTVAEYEGIIAGWCVTGPGKNRAAWVFVRPMFRTKGLAKLLLESSSINLSAPIYSPFVPNRDPNCRLRLTIRQRPFLAALNVDAQN